jgi:Type I phosphodiesterase / nucleotide pyrophosphatase
VTALIRLALKPARSLAVALFLLNAPDAFARNVIIFVVDGLRQGSVNPEDAPALASIRAKGVFLKNSHSLFPTLTTPNASAIATGHYLGDTGDFSNTIYTGYPIGSLDSTQTPFIESDSVLGDINRRFGGNFLDEETFLGFAKNHGFGTAAVGKLGPTLIQAITEGNPGNAAAPVPATVVIDDATGKKGGLPLDPKIVEALKTANLPLVAPDRSNGASTTAPENNGYPGNNQSPGTIKPNLNQQQYFADALTRAILPVFVQEHRPFAVVFWSRDPDGAQHNQGDSLNQLSPGINGPTSKAAVRNADNNLKQILDYLQSVPALAEDADIFVTSDHGFSTISKSRLQTSDETTTASYAATKQYRDNKGRQEVNSGFLPSGFLAIDLAQN